MPTIQASTIFTKAGILLNDVAQQRWPVDELLAWFNDGQDAVVAVSPSASTSLQVIPRTYVTAKQALPAGAISLVSVLYNTNSTGLAVGPAIRLVDRDLLDSRYPDWHGASAAHVQGYVYSKDNPRVFYTWGRPVAGRPEVYTHVMAEVVMHPTRLTNASQVMSLPDEYAECLLNYILFRAHSKETEEMAAQKAQLYYQAFVVGATNGGAIPVKSGPASAIENTVLNPNTATHYARG